jgi:hypothetical protein
MGLGKTLTILSLIVRSLDEARALNTRSGCLLSVPGEMIRSGATLIVAPVSGQSFPKPKLRTPQQG